MLIEGLVPGTTSSQRYSGVKNARWKYVDFATGPDALYDLKDPYTEMHNLAGQSSYSAIQSSLAARLAVLQAR